MKRSAAAMRAVRQQARINRSEAPPEERAQRAEHTVWLPRPSELVWLVQAHAIRTRIKGVADRQLRLVVDASASTLKALVLDPETGGTEEVSLHRIRPMDAEE